MIDTPPILVVDDQEKLLRLVVMLMNRIGFPEVDGVTSGPEALDRMRERRYALVISDLDMEPMDGITLLREIRADDALMISQGRVHGCGTTDEMLTPEHLAQVYGVDCRTLSVDGGAYTAIYPVSVIGA